MLSRSNMPSYKTNDPKGWCGDITRGAALGRKTLRGDSSYNGKMTLRRSYLDSGGYDKNGTYFGRGGGPLYWYASEDGSIDGMLRAKDRETAKAEIRKEYPEARFYN